MKVAVCYVNPIEFHGTHLTLRNDYEISRGLTERLIGRLQKRIPNIEVSSVHDIQKGCDAAKGPGTEQTSLSELRQTILTTCEEIERSRPDFVLFMTFHGSPKHARAIQSGVSYFKRRGIPAYNPFNLMLKMVRDYHPSVADGVALLIPDRHFAEEWQKRMPEDFHGGLFETSVMLACDPTKVDPNYKNQPDCPQWKIPFVLKSIIGLTRTIGFDTFSRDLSLIADAVSWVRTEPYYGYTSAPRYATAEIGEFFIGKFMPDYEKYFLEILQGRGTSPKPVLQWTTLISPDGGSV